MSSSSSHNIGGSVNNAGGGSAGAAAASGGNSIGIVQSLLPPLKSSSQKAKRKISLPWFRQGSVAQPHPTLTRQHTIDTPSSFQARLLRRQPSQNALAGVLEMTWVVSDFTATNSTELTVNKGQQVEVVEICQSRPDFCLVRMPTRGSADHHSEAGGTPAVPEGLVPLAVLKQPPPLQNQKDQQRSSPSRRAPSTNANNTTVIDHEALDTCTGENSTTLNTSSPVNKRRGFSGRKWLPPPLRKLSQGKVDKSQQQHQQLDNRPPLKKTGSDKRIKVPPEMGNKPSVSEGEEEEERPSSSSLKGAKSLGGSELANGGSGANAGTVPVSGTSNTEEFDEELEIPPPMNPIKEPILVTSPPPGVPDIEENPGKRVSSLTLKSLEGATTADLAEIEQIVKERMELHSENQDRGALHSLSGGSDLESIMTSTPIEGMVGSPSSSSTMSRMADANPHRELSAQCSSNDASSTLAFSGDESDNKPSEDSSDNAKKVESLLKKRQYVLHELYNTEEQYVRDLSLIVDGYVATMNNPECEIPMPEDLRDGKDKMVFGNIDMIYKWHKDIFLTSLKQAIENPVELAQLFRRYERKLQMYVIYCKNKPVSEYIVSEYLDTYFEELRVKLGHKLQLCDLLIKPVQRIMKYQLMLKDILKYTERAGLVAEVEPLRAAYNIMVVVPKAANDMMDVGRLQGFDGKITAQGKLLLHGQLICSDYPGSTVAIIGKNKELQVFLFEQSMIFSEVIGKKTQFTSPQYVYKAHIQANKMSLEGGGSDQFTVKSIDPNKPHIGFVCQAASEDLVHQWLTTLNDILKSQTDFLKAIQSPIAYQKELTRESNSAKGDRINSGQFTFNANNNKNLDATFPTIHKANTIGIPAVESHEFDNTRNSNTAKNAFNQPKSRRPFLGGFTLRPKYKSEPLPATPPTLASAGGNLSPRDDVNSNRRWSEATAQQTCDNCIMAPGTQARLICEWPEFNVGDVVTIVRYDATQGYLVRLPTSEDEIWLPTHVLSNYHNRKQWSFRFRKSNQSRKSIVEPPSPTSEQQQPEFRERLKDVTVQCGGRAVFKCTVKNCAPNSKQTWQKLEPNLCQLRHGRFILNSKNNEGLAILNIDNVKLNDAGIYQFTISWSDGATISCSAHLNVTNLYPPLEEPNIQVISCSSVALEWNCNDYKEFFVEYCKLGSGEWIKSTQEAITGGCYTVENLIAGETYSFRIIAKENQLVSLPSVAVTLPVTDNLRWQQDQFHRRYLELKEIARGRFSVVRLAKDRGTGVEVALKQISRRKQEHCITQAEYALLANTQHINIIRSLALFDNAPLPGVDTIVLELVRGPILFDYLSEQMEYSENDVKCYSRQLMSALNWLHKKSLAHLDIKPENVLVDVSNTTPILKLVDFGDCVNTSKNIILPPACLEFASPELVLGQPVGIHTDCWAVGVFLYVLLSGVSPFLDDSMEETTANILKCDYCFPDDYFVNVSIEAKELISKLLVLIPSQRLIMEDCLNSIWLKEIKHNQQNIISASRLKSFMQRRHPMNVNTTPTSTTSPIKNNHYCNEQFLY